MQHEYEGPVTLTGLCTVHTVAVFNNYITVKHPVDTKNSSPHQSRLSEEDNSLMSPNEDKP